MKSRSFFLTILTLCLLFTIFGCKQKVEVVYVDGQPQNVKPMNKSEEPTVYLGYYRYDGGGLDMQSVGGSTALEIIEMLGRLEKTGETVPALSEMSDEDFVESPNRGVCESGTWFVDIGDRVYRFTPDKTHLYVSDRYLGEGEELSFAPELYSYLQTVFTCWPHDYWQGEYSNGVLTVRHRYLADSDIAITVKAIDFGKEKDTQGSIALELLSKKDIQTAVHISTDGGGCIRYGVSIKAVELKAGVPKTITMSFNKADSFYYHLYITALQSNTKVALRIP